ncbi:MAG: arginyltransferase [Pseudomonadales bacterium]
MTVLAKLKIFATYPHECSYLDNKEATTLFVDPNATIDVDVYAKLSEVGFRRSGTHLYRPHCRSCNACVPARIPVELFNPSRQQRRVMRRNADLQINEVEHIKGDECYRLYADYICERHRDGDMYPPSKEQYHSFLSCEWRSTRFFEFRLADELVIVNVLDQMSNGLSAVYTFYEPNLAQRSLGAFSILWQIEKTRSMDLPSLYLGYWIKQCQKMSYKVQYRPIELYMNENWVQVS